MKIHRTYIEHKTHMESKAPMPLSQEKPTGFSLNSSASKGFQTCLFLTQALSFSPGYDSALEAELASYSLPAIWHG